jgi:mRNA-degrading endonuclease HigB of HigAB toxin-antitoxin module
MKVNSDGRLKEFIKKYKPAEKYLLKWHTEISETEASSPNELLSVFSSAETLGNNRVKSR